MHSCIFFSLINGEIMLIMSERKKTSAKLLHVMRREDRILQLEQVLREKNSDF